MVAPLSRPNTVARWQAALDRAHARGVTVRQLAGSGVWIATSGSDPLAAYVVSIDECECHAAQHGDPVCQHRAALRETLDCLPRGVKRPGGLWADVTADELVNLKAAAYRDYLAGGWSTRSPGKCLPRRCDGMGWAHRL